MKISVCTSHLIALSSGASREKGGERIVDVGL